MSSPQQSPKISQNVQSPQNQTLKQFKKFSKNTGTQFFGSGVNQKYVPYLVFIPLICCAGLGWVLLAMVTSSDKKIKTNCTCTNQSYEKSQQIIVAISATIGSVGTLFLLIFMWFWFSQ